MAEQAAVAEADLQRTDNAEPEAAREREVVSILDRLSLMSKTLAYL